MGQSRGPRGQDGEPAPGRPARGECAEREKLWAEVADRLQRLDAGKKATVPSDK